jgi:hypothetical protein
VKTRHGFDRIVQPPSRDGRRENIDRLPVARPQIEDSLKSR